MHPQEYRQEASYLFLSPLTNVALLPLPLPYYSFPTRCRCCSSATCLLCCSTFTQILQQQRSPTPTTHPNRVGSHHRWPTFDKSFSPHLRHSFKCARMFQKPHSFVCCSSISGEDVTHQRGIRSRTQIIAMRVECSFVGPMISWLSLTMSNRREV